MSKAIQALNAFGQSVWLDSISRSMIESGKLREMIDMDLRGITSNPTIFNKAITSGTDYDQKISQLCAEDKSAFEIYDDLTIRDIQDAADMFMPVYEATGGLDGYISLEINPQLAYRTEETVQEGLRLYLKVRRPNVMYKVPATENGFKAIEELLAQGININATLIFSLKQYSGTVCAYIRGIKRLLQNNGDANKVRSVASVFVSRVDTVVDKLLDEIQSKEKDAQKQAEVASLKGKAACANAGLIYKKSLDIFSSDEFKQLKSKGAHRQRVLWGSTSTKNPAYSDTKYVSELIAKDTVNTMPEQTFNAFLDHGEVKEALTAKVQGAEEVINQLAESGIDINNVCAQLLKDGVIAFEQSFVSLLSSIAEKMKTLCRR